MFDSSQELRYRQRYETSFIASGDKVQLKLTPWRVVLARIAILPCVTFLLTAAYWRAASWSVPFGPGSTATCIPEAQPERNKATANTLILSPSATPTPSTTPTTKLAPSQTPSPTITPTSTATPTVMPSSTPSSTPTPSATSTLTPTPTATPLLPTPDGAYREAQVPILMYHHIANPAPSASALERDLSVSPEKFEQQLRHLRQQGYETITLNDLALHLTVGQPLPARPIILTFDDGYNDAYLQAFPLLQRYGFAGTFFLVTAPIDNMNPDWLSWDQVSEMHAAGMRFEPHSYDHPDLRNRSFDFVVFQILAPKGAIEARTGEPCRFFAYPSGRYDQFVIDVLHSADYWGAVVTAQGATHSADDLFTLHRVRIQGDDNLQSFIAKLELDW